MAIDTNMHNGDADQIQEAMFTQTLKQRKEARWEKRWILFTKLSIPWLDTAKLSGDDEIDFLLNKVKELDGSPTLINHERKF
tara:strand:+ start:79 stop:324 length:246 start_codon:yes stop_codon:yes gene_type:complete